MNTFEDVVTVVQLGVLETALFTFTLTFILVFFTMSVKTGFGGDFIGFDFSWIRRLFVHEKSRKVEK